MDEPTSIELCTARLRLRSPQATDLEPLTAILQEPTVARYWPGFDRARVAAELLTPDPDLTVLCVAPLDDPRTAIGVVQFAEERDPQYRHASMDLFLGGAWHGRGLGQEAIRAVLSHLFETRGHHRVTIDPAEDNQRALRAYEQVGFRRVGVLRQYERRPDGIFDGVLLELLKEDYRAPQPARPAAPCALRRATAADLPLLLQMMQAFNQHEHIAWEPGAGAAPLLRLIDDANIGAALLLCQQQAVVGYAIATYGYDLEFAGRDAVLTELYLGPAARGQGLGRAALELVLAELRAQGVNAAHLQVRPDNTAALRLYQSAGFVATPRHFMTRLLADCPAGRAG